MQDDLRTPASPVQLAQSITILARLQPDHGIASLRVPLVLGLGAHYQGQGGLTHDDPDVLRLGPGPRVRFPPPPPCFCHKSACIGAETYVGALRGQQATWGLSRAHLNVRGGRLTSGVGAPPLRRHRGGALNDNHQVGTMVTTEVGSHCPEARPVAAQALGRGDSRPGCRWGDLRGRGNRGRAVVGQLRASRLRHPREISPFRLRQIFPWPLLSPWWRQRVGPA